MGLILKRWQVEFDARIEPHNFQQVWVIMPRIPKIFLQEQILKEIRNKLGKFISLDKKWDKKVDRRCAKILVELDL